MKLFFIFLSILSAVSLSANENNNAKIKAEKISDKIITKIMEFQKLLPEIKGQIISLPRAGTLGIKFSDNKISIHEGMKFVAKRKGINSEMTGNGILYLKYDRNKNITGKYLRSEVGKFDIGDTINTKWYKPIFAVGNFKDDTGQYRDFMRMLKNILKAKLNGSTEIKTLTTPKTELILEKIATMYSYEKEMKKLFGRGIDYVIFAKLTNKNNGFFIELSVLSTYTSQKITKVIIDIN